jgi:hypothetical protein
MKTRMLIAAFLAALACPLVLVSPAQAQATRTWVSGVGNDANPCSRTAPCKTWAGAISKTAAGGEIDALDPGGYGALTITKAITLDGGTVGVVSTLVAGTNGIVVQAGASDVVTLRNFAIDGIAQAGSAGVNGIRFLTGLVLHIDNMKVFSFSTHCIDDENSTSSSRLIVENSVLQNCAGDGILVKPAVLGFATITNTLMNNNGNGLVAQDGSRVTVTNSQASSNTGTGMQAAAAGSGMFLDIFDSTISENGGNGVQAAGAAATVRVSNDNVSNNISGTGLLASGGGSLLSFNNNHVVGNSAPGASTGSAGPLL